MNKIISFEKELSFKSPLNEIISISLEHDLEMKSNIVSGVLTLSGEYKSDTNTPFKKELPVDISISNNYDTTSATLEIDDFYYKVENNSLIVNIDICVGNLEEREELVSVREVSVEKQMEKEIEEFLEESEIIEENLQENRVETVNIFDNIEDSETFKSYTVYIVREEDTIESIVQKYSVDKEALAEYNEIDELKLGDKLIIPCV